MLLFYMIKYINRLLCMVNRGQQAGSSQIEHSIVGESNRVM